MFGHETIGPQIESVLFSGTVESVDQPGATSILAEKGLTLEARERQGMGVSDKVVALAGSSLGR
jgi:hypothetical protein